MLRTSGEAGCPGQQREEQVGGGGRTPYQWPDGRRREGARELREGTSVLKRAPGGGGGMGREGQGAPGGAGGRLWTFHYKERVAGGEACFPSVSGLQPSRPAKGVRGGGAWLLLPVFAWVLLGLLLGLVPTWRENKPQAYFSGF